MSVHGRLAQPRAANVLNPMWVTRHRGDLRAFMARHRRQAKRVVRLGRPALEKIVPSLLFRVSHDKTLRLAWVYLQARGGQAPGPDGYRYTDFTDAEVWRWCRTTRDEICSGEYLPGEEDILWISKGPGRGKRPLVIQSIFDRVVQRATVEILQPIIDPLFDSHSFGFRPKRSPLHALALVERYFVEERRRRVWVTADVKDAFLRVPLPRLLDIVREYLIADDLVEFIGRVLGVSEQPGLRQGGCLSPLLLNLYLHHVADRKWRRLHPDVPLIRYADDILLLCRSTQEAKEAYDALAGLLRPAGMILKGTRDGAVRRLTPEEPADWMGFLIERGQKGLRVGLAENAWWSLTENLALAGDAPNSSVRAARSIVGWIGQKGPCYPFLDADAACARIEAIAQDQGFDEIPDRGELKQHWQRAYARWCRLRDATDLRSFTRTGSPSR